MSQQIIDTTTETDTIQSGMNKVNSNFTEVYNILSNTILRGNGTLLGYTSSGPDLGEVSEIELIPASGSKLLRPIKAGVYSIDGLNSTVEFALKISGGYSPIGIGFSQNVLSAEISVDQYFPLWINGITGASLVARMTNGIPTGGYLDCWAIADYS